MARNSAQDAIDLETAERKRLAKSAMFNEFTNTILVGKKKTIMHPLDLSDGLQGFGDWLVEMDYQPSLAAMAAYMKVSKGIISECRKDPKEYYYYEIQDHMGECVSTQAIIYSDDLDSVRHGVDISLLDFLTIDFLIDNYAMKHDCLFTEEERIKIKNCEDLYVKRLHRCIRSKNSMGHELRLVGFGKRLVGHKLRLMAQSVSHKYKDIYATCVVGNVVVRKIKFSDILQYYEQIAEIEWIEAGKNARNPAMSIFMLLNNAGHTTAYQNKTITQTVITAGEKENQAYQERLDSILQENLALQSGK